MRYLLFLAVLFVGVDVLAQKIYLGDENYGRGEVKVSPRNMVGTATWDVIYAHVRRDPYKNQQKGDYEMLSVGEKYLWYGGYGDFQVDSIQRADPDYFTNMSFSEHINNIRSYGKIPEEMIVDRDKGLISFFGSVFPGDNYVYEEDLPVIDWELEDGTDKVLGYTCNKAKAKWRGREWTAWYSEIPESLGPWKFNGLPGLVLQLSDSTEDQFFIAIDIRKLEHPIGANESERAKITREKYNLSLKNYCENAGDMWVRSGMVADGSSTGKKVKKYRKFFSPIELE